MTVASLPDVAARLGRTPLPEEEELLVARLEDAEAAIAARIPDLALTAASDDRFRRNLIAVECDIALRAAGVPSRLTAVQPAPGTVYEQQDGRPGFVSVRAEEWRKLGIHMMDVWNPYPNPYDEVLSMDPWVLGSQAGWGPWWPDCE